MDIYQLNPNWKIAQNHGKSVKVGFKSQRESQITHVCPCCLNKIQKQPIPLTINVKELQVIGFGFPLFYAFLKNTMLLLLVNICSYSSLSLYQAFTHNYKLCYEGITGQQVGEKAVCHTLFLFASRIEKTVTIEEQLLRIFSFILTFTMLIYIRDKILKLHEYYDERKCSLSDYSIILKNMPLHPFPQKNIKNFFLQQFQNPHEIKQLVLMPYLQDFEHLLHKKLKIVQQLRPYYKKNIYDQKRMELETYINHINNSMEKEVEKYKTALHDDQIKARKAILILNTEDEKCEILDEFSRISDQRIQKHFGQFNFRVSAEQAPEPREIIWENAHVGSLKRVSLVLLSWCLTLSVLILVTGLFFLINERKSQFLEQQLKKAKEKQENEVGLATALVYIMLFFIVFFNKLAMVPLYHKFTHFQRHYTASDFQFSFGLKYCLGLFFTTALMTIAVEALTLQNYYQQPYGVIEEQSIMFFFNAIIVPLFWLINPFQIGKKLKQCWHYGRNDLTQKEANELMEDYPYDIGKRYAQILQTLWFTYLYSTLVPMGGFISLMGLIFYYWVDKLNLLRRASLSVFVQGAMVNFSLQLLDLTIVFWSFGILLFDYQLRDTVTISGIVMLVFSIGYFFLPSNSIIEYFNYQAFFNEQKTYEEVKDELHEDYWMLHPINAFDNNKTASETLFKYKIRAMIEIGQQLMKK